MISHLKLYPLSVCLVCLLASTPVMSQEASDDQLAAEQGAEPAAYFSTIAQELKKEWPNNRLVRFVFHGHSVPAGYFKTPEVRRFDSYPTLFHQRLCELYSKAVIDVSVTAIGGENSSSGAKRFDADVLVLKPDVVFIDYCLNDRRLGLAESEVAWRSMIEKCIEAKVLVVLLTPTPDSRENISDDKTPLMQHAEQVRRLGAEYAVPVVDSYAAFRALADSGQDVEQYLSQINHPNRKGHDVVADLLVAEFQRGL